MDATEWLNCKHANLGKLRIPEREKIENATENVFGKIMVENFPSLKKNADIQALEAQRVLQ